MEYYHLPAVHPALCQVSQVDNHHRRQGPGQYVGFVTSPLTAAGSPIDPGVLPSYPGLVGDEHHTAVFHLLFPTTFYFLLPSHTFTATIVPVSPTQSIEYTDLLIHPSVLEEARRSGKEGELNQKLDGIMGFYDMVNLEDVQICEQVQLGVKANGYPGGRVSYRFEETIHRFQNILIDHMCGYAGRIPNGDEKINYYIGGQPDDVAAASLHRG
jgi:phenylpropionate dioxygenase-like ring-hydroxylating dioxygenase large terminal subunit